MTLVSAEKYFLKVSLDPSEPNLYISTNNPACELSLSLDRGKAMTLTLDTNCIIDVELNEGAAAEIRRLLAKHETGEIELRVAGIVASERLRGGGYSPKFGEFEQRIQRLSSRAIRVLKPIGHWDVTYWDEGLCADDSMIDLEGRIHSILFSTPYRWVDIANAQGLDSKTVPDESNAEWRKWRNRLCDSSAMWCHIYHGGDMFVTRDAKFLAPAKRAALESLGAKRIVDPVEACREVGA
jgi:hypothetical protein